MEYEESQLTSEDLGKADESTIALSGLLRPLAFIRHRPSTVQFRNIISLRFLPYILSPPKLSDQSIPASSNRTIRLLLQCLPKLYPIPNCSQPSFTLTLRTIAAPHPRLLGRDPSHPSRRTHNIHHQLHRRDRHRYLQRTRLRYPRYYIY